MNAEGLSAIAEEMAMRLMTQTDGTEGDGVIDRLREYGLELKEFQDFAVDTAGGLLPGGIELLTQKGMINQHGLTGLSASMLMIGVLVGMELNSNERSGHVS
jgi:hypothetical protein